MSLAYKVHSRKACNNRMMHYVLYTDPKGVEYIVSDFTKIKAQAQIWRDRLAKLDPTGAGSGRLTA